MAFASTTNPIVSVLAGGRDTQAADQGNYFVAITPTPGTGIVGTASVQAFTQTTPVFICANTGLLNIYPMSLRTHLTVVGATASVAENMTFVIGNGNPFATLSVGVALTINNLNMGSNTASGALIWAGGVTATAMAGARTVAHVQKKHTVIEVVHDTTTYMWGGTNAVSFSSTVANTTTPTYSAHNLPPVVIGPGQSMVIVEWAAAQTTGSTNEYMFSYIEK